MGILNITPDSFFESSRHINNKNIAKTIKQMFDDGADIIDIGAMSSRPGAEIISEDEEYNRLKPVFETIISDFPDKNFSIDTIRSSIAKKAVCDYGFAIINDITGGNFDAQMFATVAECKVPFIVMHMRGNPADMQQLTDYQSITDEIILYFSQIVRTLNNMGVNDIIIDPGFGFSKTIEQNYYLLNKLETFKIFDLPILAGLSRKSMIWKSLNISPSEALNGTSVLNSIALQKGANILRVHDVKEAKEVVHLHSLLKANQNLSVK
ncbi:MAG: dihydropteroate synthase [Bacteroidales bacterium]|nr:dihydropteroate synthase [Bacteroidales bacterium]